MNSGRILIDSLFHILALWSWHLLPSTLGWFWHSQCFQTRCPKVMLVLMLWMKPSEFHLVKENRVHCSLSLRPILYLESRLGSWAGRKKNSAGWASGIQGRDSSERATQLVLYSSSPPCRAGHSYSTAHIDKISKMHCRFLLHSYLTALVYIYRAYNYIFV